MNTIVGFLKDNWSDVVALAALIISIGQIVVGVIQKRTRLSLTIENVQQEHFPNETAIIVLCTIVNRSSAPINITRMLLTTKEGKRIMCNLRKVMIGEHHYPKYPETDIPVSVRAFSEEFPLALGARGAISAQVVFFVPAKGEDFLGGEMMELNMITDKRNVRVRDLCKIHDDHVMWYM